MGWGFMESEIKDAHSPDNWNLTIICEGKDNWDNTMEKCSKEVEWFNKLCAEDVDGCEELQKCVRGDGAFLNAMTGLATCAAKCG